MWHPEDFVLNLWFIWNALCKNMVLHYNNIQQMLIVVQQMLLLYFG
jgi:hypothetical protein